MSQDIYQYKDLDPILKSILAIAMTKIQNKDDIVITKSKEGVVANSKKPYIINFRYNNNPLILSYNFTKEPETLIHKYQEKNWYFKKIDKQWARFNGKITYSINFDRSIKNFKKVIWDLSLDKICILYWLNETQKSDKNLLTPEDYKIQKTIEKGIMIKGIKDRETIKQEMASELIVSCVEDIDQLINIALIAITKAKIEQKKAED